MWAGRTFGRDRVNDEVMEEQSQVDPQAERFRLRGEALEAWYRRNAPGQTPEEWEAEWKQRSEELAQTIELFTWGWVVLLTLINFVYPFLSGALAGVLGLWVVLGSGSPWLRVGATAAVTFVLGIAHPDLMAFLLIIVTTTACLGYLASFVAAHTRRMPTRLLQFSLSDIAAFMLAMAAGMAMLRGSGFTLKRFADPEHALLFVVAAVLYALNVLFAASPILVPRRYRGYGWIVFAAVMALIVMPIIEWQLLEMLQLSVRAWMQRSFDNLWRESNDPQVVFQYFSFAIKVRPGGVPIGELIPMIHVGGACVVWLLIFMLEGAGAFHDVDISKLTKPAEGPLD